MPKKTPREEKLERALREVVELLRTRPTNQPSGAAYGEPGDPRNHGHPLHDSRARYAYLVAKDALKASSPFPGKF